MVGLSVGCCRGRFKPINEEDAFCNDRGCEDIQDKLHQANGSGRDSGILSLILGLIYI